MDSGEPDDGNFSMDVATSMTICEGNLTSQKAVHNPDIVSDQASNHLQINTNVCNETGSALVDIPCPQGSGIPVGHPTSVCFNVRFPKNSLVVT